MNWKLLFFLMLNTLCVCAQNKYSVQNFSLLKHAELEGEHSSSRGLLVQFALVPNDTTLLNKTVGVEVGVRSGPFYVLKVLKTVNLADSLILFQLPYRKINLEEGVHNAQILIQIKGERLPIFLEQFRLNQPKVFDLFLELNGATIEPDSGYNPIGLNSNAPDPVWAIKVHNELQKGLVERNSFEPLPYKTTTTITKFDSLAICIYDEDPLAREWLACYEIPHGEQALEKEFKNHPINERVTNSSFHITKLEREKMSSSFETTENYIHKGIKGVRIDLDFGLPYHYRRKNISIKIKNDQNQAIENCLALKSEREQIKNRIVGAYSYFIPYHNLQNNNKITLKIKANKTVIKQYFADSLVIPKTVDEAIITQKTAYKYEGISGILYRLEYQLPELDKQAQLSLSFPTLSVAASAKLKYWSATEPTNILAGTNGKIPALQQQTIFVFLPYYVSPKRIHLQPKLLLTNIDVPTIEIANFESEPYMRPNELSDITIKTKQTKDYNYTGLAGVLFEYETNIPEYYHSKGNFILQILEDGAALEDGFFINEDSYGEKKRTIKNQNKITVFLPYRAMKNGKKYEVKLQAISNDFALSELRAEQYSNSIFGLNKVGLYISQLNANDWKKVAIKIGVRNFKNINRTYPHLGYEIVAKDTLAGMTKAKMPKAYSLVVHPLDEIVLWIKDKDKPDGTAQVIKTSVAALIENNKELKLKNERNLKNFVLKLVQK